MSTITREDVLKLAELSRLQLRDEEVERYQKELSKIFNYVEMLGNSDLDAVAPTYQVNDLTNVLREDKVINYSATPQQLLKNAPHTEKDQFKVKRMVG